MPLSEEELRMLEQMERALVEEDPKLASTLRGTAFRRAQQRRAVGAGVVFAGGIALLMTGVVSGLWAVGIIGFVVMLGSATIGLNALRGRPLTVSVHPGDDRRQGPRVGSFMERVEERWRRRRHGW